jgi:hypothetical protein
MSNADGLTPHRLRSSILPHRQGRALASLGSRPQHWRARRRSWPRPQRNNGTNEASLKLTGLARCDKARHAQV